MSYKRKTILPKPTMIDRSCGECAVVGVPNPGCRTCDGSGEIPITEVVFRVWIGKDKTEAEGVLALFPYEQAAPGYCDSFEHIGQHGSADYRGLVGGGWNRRTRPAKPEEYAGLKRELENCYGYRLKVIKRANWDRHSKAIGNR
jgi:hypothetical protein